MTMKIKMLPVGTIVKCHNRWFATIIFAKKHLRTDGLIVDHIEYKLMYHVDGSVSRVIDSDHSDIFSVTQEPDPDYGYVVVLEPQ